MTQPLKLHNLHPAPGAKKAKNRVGRGEGSKGKTAGRGTKGTKARGQVPASFEGGQMPIHMRLPKLKGFKNPFKVEFQVVNLDRITELFPEGGDVTVDELVARGAVRKNQPVKVLGQGEIDVKVAVTVNAFSASAKEKIEAAGAPSPSCERLFAWALTVRLPRALPAQSGARHLVGKEELCSAPS